MNSNDKIKNQKEAKINYTLAKKKKKKLRKHTYKNPESIILNFTNTSFATALQTSIIDRRVS